MRVQVGAVLRGADRRFAGARGHGQHGGGERAQLARDQASCKCEGLTFILFLVLNGQFCMAGQIKSSV